MLNEMEHYSQTIFDHNGFSGSPFMSTTPRQSVLGNLTLYLDIGQNSSCRRNTSGPDCSWNFYGYYVDYMQIKVVTSMFIVIAVILTLFGLLGNTLVLLTIWRHKSMHTATNYYIFSLALSDLLMSCFVTPFKIIELTFTVDQSFFSATICTFTHYIMPVVVFTSIWTLVSVSIDRFTVIIYPLKARAFNTKSRAKRNLCLIWLAACVVNASYLYPLKTIKFHMESQYGVITRLMCMDRFDLRFRAALSFGLFLILFCIPLIILAFTCCSIACRLFYETDEVKMLKKTARREHEKRKKVAKMVLVLIVAFVVSWTPFFMMSMISTLTNILNQKNFIFVLSIIHTCASINSTINPLIYVFMSARFRHGYCNIMAVFIYPCGGKRFMRNIERTRRVSVSDSTRSDHDFSLRRKSSALSNISSERRTWTSVRSIARKESTLTSITSARSGDDASMSDNTTSLTCQEQHSLL